MVRRVTAKSAAPVEEPEVDEFEEMEADEADEVEDGDDLEELEEVEEPEEAPKPKGKRSTAAAQKARADSAPKFGSAELAAHVSEVTGENYDARGIRMLLRKLAKDGTLARVVGETRDRYSFTGPEDEIVKAVVTMVKDGTAKALKQAGLEKVKADAEAKRAAKKAAQAAAEAEDDEMDEVEEEAPAPKRAPARKSAPTKAAPAKATPAKATTTRRRASAAK